ncbi:MAG: hypothetical protein JO161_08615 [Planctomycetaceae bacterium]|nr:hypothetical protein [Planctomycetaceae bacterium]
MTSHVAAGGQRAPENWESGFRQCPDSEEDAGVREIPQQRVSEEGQCRCIAGAEPLERVRIEGSLRPDGEVRDQEEETRPGEGTIAIALIERISRTLRPKRAMSAVVVYTVHIPE